MTYRVLLFILLTTAADRAYCQKDSVFLSGNVDSSLHEQYLCDELNLVIKKTTNTSGKGQVIKAKIGPDGNFSVKVKADSLLYLSFKMLNKNGKLLDVSFYDRDSRAYFSEVYLFEKGDSVNVNIRKGGVFSFKGTGSEKLNCQYQMYSIDAQQASTKSRASSLNNRSDYAESIALRGSMLNLAIQMRLQILNSYKAQLSDRVYRLLRLDAVASAKYQLFVNLSNLIRVYPGNDSVRSAAKSYYPNVIEEDRLLPAKEDYISESAYYADMLFIKETCYLRLYADTVSGRKYDLFAETLKRLKQKYSGRLLDKLIYICFQRLGSQNVSESGYAVKEVLDKMQDEEYKQLLTEWKDEQFSAYPFALQDTAGKTHTLNDYKGKLIVIDFWYTGCVWCVKLNAAMHPILRKYKDYKDVVFLTVSVDVDKEKWKESVLSGKYTSAGTVNLYTNGQGSAHPLIQNYNFNGYPAQLIIGKAGELITSSPPRADINETNIEEFIRIIDINL